MTVVVETKQCTKCREERLHSEFYKDKYNRDGLMGKCRYCDSKYAAEYYKNNSEHQRAYNDKYYKIPEVRERQKKYMEEYGKTNAGRIKENARRRDYGLEQGDYLRMHTEQNGKCLICKKPETMVFYGKVKALSVDHCHKTGMVRGLLCHSCNVGLGHFKDDPVLLKEALAHVEKWAQTESS